MKKMALFVAALGSIFVTGCGFLDCMKSSCSNTSSSCCGGCKTTSASEEVAVDAKNADTNDNTVVSAESAEEASE